VDLGEADAFAGRWVLERATENGDDAVVRRIQRVAASGQPTPLQGFRIAADIGRYVGYAENLKLELVHFPWGYWRRAQTGGTDERARYLRRRNA